MEKLLVERIAQVLCDAATAGYDWLSEDLSLELAEAVVPLILQAREEAWDEGFEYAGDNDLRYNPYRKAEQ
jgi:hypothetical protein